MARDFGEFGSVARAGDWDELETGAEERLDDRDRSAEGDVIFR
jgi:hypothetical protein